MIADEHAFVQSYLNELSSCRVLYGGNVADKPVADSSAPMTIAVKIIKPSAELSVPALLPTDTILTLKEKIHAQRADLPVDQQRLLLKGKALADLHKTLADYNIQPNSKIHLTIKASSS